MNEDINALLQLNGTQKERDWLQENMETLSVRERTILAAVFQQHPPASISNIRKQNRSSDMMAKATFRK